MKMQFEFGIQSGEIDTYNSTDSIPAITGRCNDNLTGSYDQLISLDYHVSDNLCVQCKLSELAFLISQIGTGRI